FAVHLLFVVLFGYGILKPILKSLTEQDSDLFQSKTDPTMLRVGTERVLLVFTDGLDDTIEMLRTTADSLHIKGLDALLMVGLENMQDLNELQEIEFGRGFGYKQPLSIGFPELPNILRKELDVVAERKCCNILAKCVGEHGFRGVTGPPGRKGGVGFKGSPGHPGEEGGN
ncbi:unnamed protein product, partial [Eretmochelys imbricata]